MNRFKTKSIVFLRILRNVAACFGIFFLICLLLASTELPFWGYYWLGTSKSGLKVKPETIIILGGGGMPSQSNLIRNWYAAQASKSFQNTTLILSVPGNLADSMSTPVQMKKDLVLRGVSDTLVIFEEKATNTRWQALNCGNLTDKHSAVMLITSPEHMRRAVLCFYKAGFTNVSGLPAFENAMEADLKFDDDKLGGNKTMLPDVGESINTRYQFWNHLKYEILIAREIAALSYYRLRGWI